MSVIAARASRTPHDQDVVFSLSSSPKHRQGQVCSTVIEEMRRLSLRPRPGVWNHEGSGFEACGIHFWPRGRLLSRAVAHDALKAFLVG